MPDEQNSNLYFTGRGGAGNVRKGKPAPEPEEEKRVPELKQKIFTTGRGGAGNMMQNDESGRLAREAQDVEATPADLAPVCSPSIGRGGYGNVKAGQKAESLFSKARKALTRHNS